MDKKNLLLVLMFIYCAVGIMSLIFAHDAGIATASLSSPEKRKTESEAEPETAFLESGEPKTTKPDVIDDIPAYTYTAIHSTGRLFIRSGPSLENQIISFMRPGTTGPVVSIGDEWVLLKYGDVEGYVFKGYLKLTEVEQ